MKKSDLIRSLLPEIAAWRVDGKTWREVAAELASRGISVTPDEIRAYWPRISDRRTAEEILLVERRERVAESETEMAAMKSALANSAETVRRLRDEIAALSRSRDAAEARATAAESAVTGLEAKLAETADGARNWKLQAILFEKRAYEFAGTRASASEQHRMAQALRTELKETNGRLADAETSLDVTKTMLLRAERRATAAAGEMARLTSQWMTFGSLRFRVRPKVARLEFQASGLRQWLCEVVEVYRTGNSRSLHSMMKEISEWAQGSSPSRKAAHGRKN